MRTITVTTSSGSYTVSIGSGLLASLPSRVAALAEDRSRAATKVFVLTSPEIWAVWGERVLAAFAADTPKAQPTTLFLAAGEQHKRLAEVERLCAELARAGADRSSLLLAFGGGVIGDVGGFVAAIYMRGIPYVQVPTTLLAQVDSSVGGKTGVNLLSGKNLVGAFHPPRAVVADIDVLRTLSDRELHAGLYESIKAGLIRDARLFRYIEANHEALGARDLKILEAVVAGAVRMKAEVVGLDERESGLRMILNFGHTLGHAIETTSGYGALLHGEAVAWGMLAGLHISRERRALNRKDAERAAALILRCPLPALPPVKAKTLLQSIAGDKKNRAGARRFILLKRIGEAFVADDVSDGEIADAIGYIQALPQTAGNAVPAAVRGSRGIR